MAWASTIPNAGIELTPNSSHLAEASRGQELIRQDYRGVGFATFRRGSQQP
jgi:hypothetical protein